MSLNRKLTKLDWINTLKPIDEPGNKKLKITSSVDLKWFSNLLLSNN
jgi:hypothetical protein